MKKIINYLSEVVRETKKVTWPNREQTQNKTILVIVVSLLVGAYIGALDFIMSQIMGAIL